VAKSEISALGFNSTSTMVLSGESSGELICWDWKKKKKLWKVPKAHKGRILACEFDRQNSHLVTIGEDLAVKVWKVDNGELIGANRISALSSAQKDGGIKVNSVVWSPDGAYFVTVGDKFVKFWYMDSLKKNKRSHLFKTTIVEGRKALLCDVDQAEFVSAAVVPNDSSTVYAVTSNGILCTFGASPRSLQKWVNLKATRAFSIHCSEQNIMCGCSDGVIRLFTPKTLHYQGSLPKPPPIHSHLTSASINENIFQAQDGAVADAVACKITENSKYVAAMYSDRSFIMWDITDLKRVSKYRSFLAHNGCVWDIDMLPDESDGPLPDGTFVTCSEDNTLRFWNINHDNQDRGPGLRGSIAEKSIFSRDLLHVVSMPKKDSVPNGKEGIRCCKFTPNGCHVMSGDRRGNVRVHDVFKFNAISDQCAHDAEVLSVDAVEFDNGSILLASGSRDNLIHLYDLSEDVGTELVDTLSDHGASITSIKFACAGSKLLSCSADKTIVFRNVTPQASAHYAVEQSNKATIPKGKIYDMDTDATQKYIITAGSDKKLHIWNIRTAKSIRSYQADKKGEPLKVRTDPAGIHAVTSSSDKILRLYDFYSGACYAKFRGHSGVITGIRFTNDCRHLISVGSEGCIFIWKLANDLRKAMQLRMSEMKERKKKVKKEQAMMKNVLTENVDEVPMLSSHSTLKDKMEKGAQLLKSSQSVDGTTTDDGGVALIFRDTQLPSWARPKTGDENRPKTSPSVHPEGGVWAQRIASNIALRPNTASNDDDVQPLLHSMSKEMTQDSTGKMSVDDNVTFHTAAEEEDDVNLSDEESESDKDEEQRPAVDDDERVVYFKQEEEKERFVVASVDNLPNMKMEQEALEKQDQKEEEQLETLEPVDEDVEFPDDEVEEQNKEFVKENYGNLDKPIADRAGGVRQSFSSAFFRQSLAQNNFLKAAKKAKKVKEEESESEEDIEKEKPMTETVHSEPKKTTPSKPQVQEIDQGDVDEDMDKGPASPQKATSPSHHTAVQDLPKDDKTEDDFESNPPTSPNSDPGPYALEAGYGRLSNDTFADNFRKVAGNLSPPPTLPEGEDQPNSSSIDELRFLRKKYKIPTSLTMSSKIQKAKAEAHQGLEDYMKRRQEEEEYQKSLPPSNEKEAMAEKDATPSTLEAEKTPNDTKKGDKKPAIQVNNYHTMSEQAPIKKTSPAKVTEPDKSSEKAESPVKDEKKQAEATTPTKPPSPASNSEKKDTPEQENAIKLPITVSDADTPSTATEEIDTTSEEQDVSTPVKKDESKVRFDSTTLDSKPHAMLLPPRTPDVGQYSNLLNGDSYEDAPRALQAVTPMPYSQQKSKTIGATSGQSKSIVLRKSVDEYRAAMENLRQSFTAALSLYDEANTDLQKSRATMSMPKEEEKPVTDLLEGFEDIFRQMHQKIDQRNPLKSSVNVSKEQVDLTLEKYSEMLLGMVAQKLNKQGNK